MLRASMCPTHAAPPSGLAARCASRYGGGLARAWAQCPSVAREAQPRRRPLRLRRCPPPGQRRVTAAAVPPEQEQQHLSGGVPQLSAQAEGGAEHEAAAPKGDLFKALALGFTLLVSAGALQHDWVGQHQGQALSVVFVLGYAGIIFEEYFSFNKSGVALLTAVAMWTVRAAASTSEAELNASLSESLAEVGQIVFFLLGAMTVVETVDAHAGFKIVTDAIGKRDNRTLLWLVGVITFFLSAILDNLTSTIVMVSLLRKLVPVAEQRKLLGAVVVIAANAGGAWTPIGDVTTTMLWISGQISALATMQDVFLPAATSLLVPLAMLSAAPEFAASSWPGGPATSNQLVVSDGGADAPVEEAMAPRATLVLTAGLASLIFVPIFKSATGLPPYLGMLAGLGALWVLTDAIHYGEPDRQQLKVPEALGRIDLQGILFFLGILMAISSLDSAGVLRQLAGALDSVAPNVESVALAIGLVSAVIDNVPLVAATQGMYDMAAYPQDCALWQLIAFCAGTGGSILIIGSAAGVAFMGLERASFEWYAKKVTPLALGGYLAGTAVYVGTHALFPHAS